jgi:hypothetical protein
MKKRSTRNIRLSHPQPVPREYGGKWIAWTRDAMRIVAAGRSPEDVKAAAARAGVTDIAYEWVPPADERFIGAR